MIYITDNIVTITIGLTILILPIVAIILNRKWLSLLTIIVLSICIYFREYGVYSIVRNYPVEKAQTQGFFDGAMYVVDYCNSTSFIVYTIMLLILIICYRGYTKNNKN